MAREPGDAVTVNQSTLGLGGLPTIELVHGETPGEVERLTQRFDVLLTDPPYNSKRKSYFALPWQKHQNRDFGEWDSVANTDYTWLRSAMRVLKENAALLIFSPFERLGDYEALLEDLGCVYRTAIVWHKTNGVVHVPAYKSSVEAIIYASRGKPFFRPWETQKSFAAHNFIEGPSCMGNERRRWDHPTQKPEYLLQRLLLRHSEPGFWVLDPFMGVGSVPAVCLKSGRNCVAIEKDAEYFRRAQTRISELGGNA